MLKDVDTGDRAFLFRALAGTVPAALLISAAVAFYLHETRHIGGWAMAGVVAVGAIAGAGTGFLAWVSADRTGRGIAHVLLAAGNLPPAPSFSYQESLVARGRLQEAVASFEAHLGEHPDDQDARLAMANILAGPLHQPDAAARIFRAVRARARTPSEEFRAHQALIDLHRATGDRGALMAELARFADRYRATAAGRAARELLADLKRER